MPNVKNNASAQETCRKLIEAAGEIFAERGLHAATIKDITTRAGVNCAAINYHFSDQFELYAEVIRYAVASSPCGDIAIKEGTTVEERMRDHIAVQIDDMYSRTRPTWHTTLIAHELAQPTEALKAIMDELIRPRIDRSNAIVRDILGPGATDKEVAYASMSIGGQCFLHTYHQEIIKYAHPKLAKSHHRDEVIDHITFFSLHALYAMRDRIRERETAKA
ncbi:MAG: CerR family C-terminal domain-containing protein [Puniceicoccales bacterium]